MFRRRINENPHNEHALATAGMCVALIKYLARHASYGSRQFANVAPA